MAYSQYFSISSQLLSNTSVSNTTAPTFAGISSLTQNSDGSITAGWSAATGSAASPFSYYIYLLSATSSGLFNSANLVDITQGTSKQIFVNTAGRVLQVGQTYFVGVRAVSAVGISDTNVVTLSVTITNINYANLAAAVWDQLKSAHVTAGTFGAALQANVDVNTSTLAPAATALSTAQWTNARAADLDNLDVAVSTRASQTSVNGIPTNPLLTSDTRLNHLDADISSRASAANLATLAATVGTPAGASVSADIASVKSDSSGLRTDYTTVRAAKIDNLDAAISTRATAANLATLQTSVNSIPTNPLLTTDARLNNLDATISSRASSTSLSSLISTIGTPAGASVSIDLASVKADTSGLRADYTTARAAKIDNLDAAISTRATASAVAAIPTTPQLASVALTQYNALSAAVGSIQNNANFSGVVPSYMDEQYGSNIEDYTFYASVFNSINSPVDPDSNILNFTVKDNMNNILQAQTPMTRVSTGQYTGVFTVTSAMLETDVVVFFDYAISSVNFEQVRTSKITSTATDSANIAAIKAKTDNLPSDPASNTVVNTRASQTSVNAIPTNPLLTNDSRVSNLDATISSRATQVSVNTIPTNPLITTDSRLNNLDATISSRASATNLSTLQTSVNAIPVDPLLTTDTRLNHLDADISSRATASAVAAIPTNPLLTSDTRLNHLDADISSRASQTSVNAIPTNPLTSTDARLNNLDAAISSRATASAVAAIPTNPLLTTDSRLNNLDTSISSRASQSSLDADFGNTSTLVTNLQSTSVSIATTESALATDVTNLSTEVAALSGATTAITTAATDVEAAATQVENAASLVVATVL